ncbi:MAG TPA: TolC family protein [Geobacteraceae bacterium]|nr:TolC family protein [Geobacteraceae bacterium]
MKRSIFALLFVIVSAGGASAQGERQLTLKEAIKMAVERNLDVQAELYNTASAEADIHRFTGIYNPLLNLQANYEYANTEPINKFTTGGQSINRQENVNYNAGVNQLISTGGTLGAQFNNTWNTNNAGVGVINDYFQSNLTFTVTQPLLQNFGRDVTEINISVARLSKEGSLEQFKTKLMGIISQVRTQYYLLYSARENLKVKKTSLELAETILNNTKAQVKAGVLPAMEILNAEFGVATQQKSLIDAERTLKDQVDQLRLLLQLPGADDIAPTDTPYQDKFQVDEDGAIRRALAERPDLNQLRVAVKTNELQSRVARNQTLPNLAFTGSAAFNGLDNRYHRDLERVGSGHFPIFFAGLQLTYPIGNDAAENAYIKSKLLVDQTKTQVRSLEESISKDVRTGVRAIYSGYKQLEVTSRGRAYAEEVVQAYIKKQKVGLATTKDVLDVLNNQVTAEGNQIQAVADYNNAITTFWATTGELLEKEGIRVTAKEADDLYGKNR